MPPDNDQDVVPPEVNASQARRDEVVPIARKVLKALADREDLPVGVTNGTSESAAVWYQDFYVSTIIPILVEHNVKLNNIPYIFQLVMQPVEFMREVTTASFERNRDIADARKYGLKDIDDLRVMDLDVALKEQAQEEVTVDKEVSA